MKIFQKDLSRLLPLLKQSFTFLILLCTMGAIQAQMTYSAQIDHVSCADLADGSVTITVSGGSGAYEAFWQDLNLTGLDQSDLAAGTYLFSISDMQTNEFLSDQEIVITQPEKLVANVLDLSTATFVGACDANAALDVTGGVAPYTVEWSDGNPIGDGLTVEGLCAGVATATVKDANLCEVVVGVTVEDLTQPIAAGFNVTNVSCNGASDGAITVNVSGGTGAYEVIWNDQTEASDIRFELPAGTYYALVNEISTGQIVELEIQVGEPAPMTTNADISLPSAGDSCDGEALALNLSGGTEPYEVDWMGQDPSALCYGTYDITVTDANECVEVLSVTVGQTSGIADIAENEWSVFPNPVRANGIVNIETQKIGTVEQITIIDLYGKTVQTTITNGVTNAQLSLDNVSPGIYFLSIQTDQNKVGLKKIIVK